MPQCTTWIWIPKFNQCIPKQRIAVLQNHDLILLFHKAMMYCSTAIYQFKHAKLIWALHWELKWRDNSATKHAKRQSMCRRCETIWPSSAVEFYFFWLFFACGVFLTKLDLQNFKPQKTQHNPCSYGIWDHLISQLMQWFKVMQICANALAIIIQLGISDVKRDYDVLWLTGNARRCF